MLTAAAHFTDLFDYTGWANQLTLDAIAELDEGTEASLEALHLMSHIVRAQEIWLGRVQGTEAAQQPLWQAFLLPECRTRAAASLRDWQAHLAACTADDFDEAIAYQNSTGSSFTSTLREIATHVVNHGTHHRAQISRILRVAGHTPPGTDYIFYRRTSNAD